MNVLIINCDSNNKVERSYNNINRINNNNKNNRITVIKKMKIIMRTTTTTLHEEQEWLKGKRA